MLPGYDFTREIELTDALGLGDTVSVPRRADELDGFALCHTAPLVEGRAREEMRVLKLVLVAAVRSARVRWRRWRTTRGAAARGAWRSACRATISSAYRQLIAMGGRVRWTDLRMSLAEHPEGTPREVVWSNWEI